MARKNPQGPITERLTAVLEDRGVSQRELARRLGVTEQAVSKWTTAGALRGWSRLEQICRAVGVSSDELLGIEPLERQEPPTLSRAQLAELSALLQAAHAAVSVHVSAAERKAIAADLSALLARRRQSARERRPPPGRRSSAR